MIERRRKFGIDVVFRHFPQDRGGEAQACIRQAPSAMLAEARRRGANRCAFATGPTVGIATARALRYLATRLDSGRR